MRSNRIGVTLCIIAGSFFLYCGQSASNSAHHGGPVADAMGQSSGGTCCSAPPRETPTVIFDDLVSPTPIAGTSNCTLASPVFPVGDLRTVVIHTPSCHFVAQVRNGKAGFVIGQESICPTTTGGFSTLGRVMTVDALLGHDLRVNFLITTPTDPDGSTSCSSVAAIPLTIVGYKNP